MKRGERYFSTVWLNPATHQPQILKITRVTKDTIYYRPDYGLHDDGSEWLGAPAYIDNTPRSIEKWLKHREVVPGYNAVPQGLPVTHFPDSETALQVEGFLDAILGKDEEMDAMAAQSRAAIKAEIEAMRVPNSFGE